MDFDSSSESAVADGFRQFPMVKIIFVTPGIFAGVAWPHGIKSLTGRITENRLRTLGESSKPERTD